MASSSITSWQIGRERVKEVTDFIFLGSKIIADSACSHEIESHLTVGRKAMTNLDSVLKAAISLCKVRIVKAMVFLVVMYRCKSWTIKKAEQQRTNAFGLWCYRRLLWSSLDSKEIKPVNPKGHKFSFIYMIKFCLVAQWWKNLPAMQDMQVCRFDPSAGKIPWRRKWHPTPVFLPGKSHGQRSLAGYSPWGCKELDMTSTKPQHTYDRNEHQQSSVQYI